MNINTTLAAQNYNAMRTATAPKPASGETSGSFTKVAQDFATTLVNSEEQAKAAMTSGADPNSLVQALAQTELAVETAVSVRDRVVEAYQEILRMPV
ncbi:MULTISPECIES: flagellar hook-basal body complex protein FliE [Halocynthiibacter]|uniref:Flagellar hook-basal body complex protein FliE n=1 Tax=Halocynthiibacter halioticoli TaxID=2986804 RepID=A0AAE3IY57_9RHOB|nr:MULTISPECIES: flagellar hook-basal body complex protein FliE [Halocynthiibacter]MCV6823071.1 flagellar hook-basal body complex protein FliE [Halocynthiibacter halioticoli]MCW4056072.1 flagellar hook-basal body complex protein FliE [Halocynthiibacter sp. SDUM655004]MDE0591357.1 flagellar hook-basal body complex protein FliE [Halocynthiibacter sp. C4]